MHCHPQHLAQHTQYVPLPLAGAAAGSATGADLETDKEESATAAAAATGVGGDDSRCCCTPSEQVGEEGDMPSFGGGLVPTGFAPLPRSRCWATFQDAIQASEARLYAAALTTSYSGLDGKEGSLNLGEAATSTAAAAEVLATTGFRRRMSRRGLLRIQSCQREGIKEGSSKGTRSAKRFRAKEQQGRRSGEHAAPPLLPPPPHKYGRGMCPE